LPNGLLVGLLLLMFEVAALSVPALTRMFPVNVLLPLRVSEPLAACVMPLAPLMTPEKLKPAVPLPENVVAELSVIGTLTVYNRPLVPALAARLTVLPLAPSKLNEPPLIAVMLIVSTAPDPCACAAQVERGQLKCRGAVVLNRGGEAACAERTGRGGRANEFQLGGRRAADGRIIGARPVRGCRKLIGRAAGGEIAPDVRRGGVGTSPRQARPPGLPRAEADAESSRRARACAERGSSKTTDESEPTTAGRCYA